MRLDERLAGELASMNHYYRMRRIFEVGACAFATILVVVLAVV